MHYIIITIAFDNCVWSNKLYNKTQNSPVYQEIIKTACLIFKTKAMKRNYYIVIGKTLSRNTKQENTFC